MGIFVILIVCIIFIVFSTTRFKLHPFLSLIAASLIFGVFSGMGLEDMIQTINKGFGDTIGSVGILIIAGIIIGTFLEKSGGAYTMANLVLKWIGMKRVHSAMAFIGYIVSIPVFADSGFIVMSPLNKALSKKAGISLAGTAIALSLGLTASHTMVPPTPGPIAAAGIIEADLGQVIFLGLITSILALFIAILFAKYIGSKIYIDPVPKISQEQIAELTAKAPKAYKSFLPIVIPIILILLRSVALYPTLPFGEGNIKEVFGFVGNPVIALLIGMIISFFLPKKFDKEMISSTGWVGEALKTAAIIILITGAGGAFGKILQASDIAQLLEDNLVHSGLGIWLPFIVAAALKTAQGSSTVAIITTASLIVPLMPSMGLDTDTSRAFAVIAIGAGSTVVSHANDSFFWIFTQFSGMTVNQGYRLQSLGTGILGFSAIIILSLLSFIVG